VANAAAVVGFTVHKSYLLRMDVERWHRGERGIRTVPSFLYRAARTPGSGKPPLMLEQEWFSPRSDVVDKARSLRWEVAVLKPCVGGGSRLARVFAVSDELAASVRERGCACLGPEEARHFASRCLSGTGGPFHDGALFVEEPTPGGDDMLLQPFQPTVLSMGELSVVVVRGADGRPRVSHAVRKVPKRGEYRVQGEFGAREVSVEPSAAEARMACTAFRALVEDGGQLFNFGDISTGLGYDFAECAARSLGLPGGMFGEPRSVSADELVAVCRVDMLSPAAHDTDQRPQIIEIEAIEPSLFIQVVPEGMPPADAEALQRDRADAIAAAILSTGPLREAVKPADASDTASEDS